MVLCLLFLLEMKYLNQALLNIDQKSLVSLETTQYEETVLPDDEMDRRFLENMRMFQNVLKNIGNVRPFKPKSLVK